MTTNNQLVGVGSGTEGLQILIAGGKLGIFTIRKLGNSNELRLLGVRTQIIEQIGPAGDYVPSYRFQWWKGIGK